MIQVITYKLEEIHVIVPLLTRVERIVASCHPDPEDISVSELLELDVIVIPLLLNDRQI